MAFVRGASPERVAAPGVKRHRPEGHHRAV